ncbi:MAG: glycosyltransferase family 4 protein [Patescibacteria group bacterium]|nr:glycosyltransferase family 4 protein [Patescibacteria group bacterium]
MKIGIDARMYRSTVAGIGRYSQNLIKNLLALDKNNEYILFMTLADKKEFENYFIENSLKIENYKLKIVVVDIPHFSLAEQTKLPKILEKENLDLMHFLNFNYPMRYKGKFITTIHDLTLLFYPQAAKDMNLIKHLGFRLVMKKACQNATKIIAVSKTTKKDIIKKFKVPNEKIAVIYEAADDPTSLRHVAELRGASKKNADKPIILYVGQFRRHKNLKGLIEAYQILKQELPCKLVILGKKENLNLDISSLKDDIVMPGFVSDEDLKMWYKTASVFVMPSFYEGFGLPGLEAMMAGTPVVASRTGSLPEIYQDAALYFDPFNSRDIAAKIKEVIINKNLHDKLIQNGLRISRVYSWKKTAEETLKLYK